MPDTIKKAWLLASRLHDGQRYKTPEKDVSVPYLTHLGAVLIEVNYVLSQEPGLNAKLTRLCAILHDSLEDTSLKDEALSEQFGDEVLAGVRALTKNETLPTKRAQMEDSLARILAQPREVAIVKLCDRIDNLSPPPPSWPKEKRMAYREEAELILKQLGAASPVAAARLRKKISEYIVN
ncbi:bifunctional (p)ppGpp synthetase/guanosine-3',5'-bis(diphosphate) 3'-pyrophosphohydrolase [Neolewinella aurantiaca]|uniref:Bifunctional (P)ppGpp synthetase/guanosine-3',5'-bis(Diphosphate) 3'-pyrophosphohydrolase n=1 Tax=Neolewinella aurantiaca TaxID=2602767 RepID=A0A5C7FHZ4_9BACT|nr:HD domain-containing protein [Neolewinella aurantiaca]TXF90844.1 bifunctional (p)ppGpp synthetase/guanosine-3',5'-bis(diphosphate) 3'-pyrophosphohydrolase [Neolewinella aurantiaca]